MTLFCIRCLRHEGFKTEAEYIYLGESLCDKHAEVHLGRREGMATADIDDEEDPQ